MSNKIKNNEPTDKLNKAETNDKIRKIQPNLLDSKLVEYGLLFALALIYFFIRKNFWAMPMERDEGIYAYFGHLILEGNVPYVDFYEHRLPGIFYMYAILVGIFGDFEGLAAGITVLNIGSLFFIYLLARDWFDNRPTAFIIAITAAILGLAPEISGFTRQSEHIVVFWAMGGLYFMLKGLQQEKYKYLIWSGVFMCLAMLTKPNAVFYIVLGGMWLVSYYMTQAATVAQNIKQTSIKTAWYALGVFGTFGIMCLIMAAQGVLGDMFYWSVTFSAEYVSRISAAEGFKAYFWPTFAAVRANYSLFWAVAFISPLAYIFARAPKSAAVFKKISLFSFLLMAFMTITPSYTFYGHYWIMFVPAIAFAFGAGLYSLSEILQTATKNAIISGGTISFIFAILLFMHGNSIGADKSLGGSYYSSPKIDKIVMKTYGGNPFNEAYQVGKFVKPRLKAEDKIALIGSEPELYIYTGAHSVSRHAYFSFLMMDSSRQHVKPWQEEFKQDVETKKPKIIVFFNHAISILADPKASYGMINGLLTDFIPKNYRRIGLVDLVGTGQPRYVFDQAAADAHQFAQAANGGQIWTILIFERND